MDAYFWIMNLVVCCIGGEGVHKEKQNDLLKLTGYDWVKYGASNSLEGNQLSQLAEPVKSPQLIPFRENFLLKLMSNARSKRDAGKSQDGNQGFDSLVITCDNGRFNHNGQCLTRWQICGNVLLYIVKKGKCDPCQKGYYVPKGSFYCIEKNQSHPEHKPTGEDVSPTKATSTTDQPETTPTPHASDKVVVDNATADPNSEVKAHDNETLSNVTDTMVAKNSSDEVTSPTKPPVDEHKVNSGFPAWAVVVIILIILIVCGGLLFCLFRSSLCSRKGNQGYKIGTPSTSYAKKKVCFNFLPCGAQ